MHLFIDRLCIIGPVQVSSTRQNDWVSWSRSIEERMEWLKTV